MSKRLTEQAAVRVAPEKFTWMKYKGEKAKLLTHTKRNGDKVRARLETNDVYGYRDVTQRSTGKELVQIVLKSDDMDLAYNLSPRSFNTNIWKYSRATVLPKKFKKPIDVKAIDTKAKKSPPEMKTNSIVWESDDGKYYIKYLGGKGSIKDYEGYKKRSRGDWVRCSQISTDKGLGYAIKSMERLTMKDPVEPKDNPIPKTITKPTTLGDPISDRLNGYELPEVVGEALGGTLPQLRVIKNGGIADVYIVVYNPTIIETQDKETIRKRFNDTSPQGLYQDVIANSKSAVTWTIGSEFKLPYDNFVGSPNREIKIFKSKSGERYIRIQLGQLTLPAAPAQQRIGNESFWAKQDQSLIGYVESLGEKYNVKLLNPADFEALTNLAERLGLSPTDYVLKLLDSDEPTIQKALHSVKVKTLQGDVNSKEVDLGDGYRYSIEPDGTGYKAAFTSPQVLADRNVILWRTDENELKRQAEQTKEVHMNSPYLDKSWDSKWGKVVEVSLDSAPRLDEPGSEMYLIIYEDGSARTCYGNAMDKTIEEQQLQSTPEWQEQNAKDIEARERARKKSLELKAQNDKIIATLTAQITEWLDTTDYTPLQKGKILKTLLTRVNYSGTINGIMTRVEFVNSMVKDFDASATTREENKYKRPTRQRWNRMSADEQQEFEELYRLGVMKTIYSVGNYDVTRYEYLYAKFLGA